MKIRYKHQRFQAEATKCVSDVFQGQPKHDGSRTFLNKFGALSFDGFGNLPLVLDNESICENVRGIQMAEGLKPVEHLEGDGRTFTIEMETGTGKTYTYIKTMYELNARYGWSKFVIVVPSIAIREGVFKSFESMAEHFAGEYGKRMQYFIYNSKQLAKIDAFASDNGSIRRLSMLRLTRIKTRKVAQVIPLPVSSSHAVMSSVRESLLTSWQKRIPS